MQTIAVLDILGGVVVRGVAGERSKYRPIVSPLCSSANPLEVACAYRKAFGLHRIYLADLDAITKGTRNHQLYRELALAGFHVEVDLGIKQASDVQDLLHLPIDFVVGLETLADQEELKKLVKLVDVDRVIFSLDLKEQKPLAVNSTWMASKPIDIAREVFATGVRKIILLDLSRVGTGKGVGTEDIARQIKRDYPSVEVTVGGGVRNAGDLSQLWKLGIDRVLIASALHDQQLTREDLEFVSTGGN